MGDLKLVERPLNYTIGPYSKKSIRAHVKVSSTETGVIFGSIVYDAGSNTEKSVILNEIRIDVLDYISPAYTDDSSFRKMWSEFEWENKVIVHTSMTYVAAQPLLVLQRRPCSLVQGPQRVLNPHTKINQHELPHASIVSQRRLWIPLGQPPRSLCFR